MAKGTSGYLKPKQKALKELNEAIGEDRSTPAANPVDAASEQMEREEEEAHGITDRIRNIFGD